MTLPPDSSSRRAARGGFTLIELLVVITIIGLLATLALPAIKGFGKSNALTAMDRQLLDDLAGARQLAIARHTTVYVVFVPPLVSNLLSTVVPPPQRDLLTNTVKGQFTSYALYTERSVGDQPGRGTTNYLTRWKSLPDGFIIPLDKFVTNAAAPSPDGISVFEYRRFPFPDVTNVGQFSTNLPYIAFNHLGQLVNARDNGSEVIPLARGSIFYPFSNNPALPNGGVFLADMQETPPGNWRTSKTTWHHIRIDGITGRAQVEQFEIPQLK